MSDIEIVISGIGGSFPQSSNVQDFGRDLLENKSLLTPSSRWKYDPKLGIKAVAGQIPYHHFDWMFFGVNLKLAKEIDPVTMTALRQSFEAVVDAGLHPHAMRGATVGVYSCSCMNELEQLNSTCLSKSFSTYSIIGSARCMLANRLSFFFNFNGPSCGQDGSWSAVHLMLQQAADDIRTGRCEAALIVASNIARFPHISALLRRLGFISDDGVTRSFDQNASGSVRSDCCVAFFLQRGDQAKRCYAKVLASSAESVSSGSFVDVSLPSPRDMVSFLKDLYRSRNIDPSRIAYLEADGGAHLIRDECELNAIDEVLAKSAHRDRPLLVGSVKSNLGQTDAVSGFAGVCKAIVAMETGTIPATINFEKANPRCKGLVEGRIRMVDKNTPLNLSADSVVAVNTVGFTCTVGHTVLQANPRPPQLPMNPEHHLPRLITVSGRTEEGVKNTLEKIKSAPFDINYYRLVQDVFSPNIRGYNYRSYIICPSNEENVFPITNVEKRTVWFAYSGMGSQWAGMGTGLMAIPIFAETIERLHDLLLKKGVDLKTIITETGPQAFDNILKSFVGIAAIQIALTNMLTAMGLVPDGIIGHSVGEQACAYADGCLTEEQTILAAWARGRASNQAELIKGSMAAVGLGYKDVLPRLPPSIDVACHNSDTSCTLSGPAEDVEQFVEELTKDGIFSKAVNVSDIAYHSRYITPAGPLLRNSLKEVITAPKRRSSKWVSTSVPLELQRNEQAQYCSIDYLTNNLLGPVLFEEGLKHIPEQSMVIEVAPHGLLQGILKRMLPNSLHIPLTQRGHADPVHFLLSAIGKTTASAAPNVSVLYPDVEFPVPRGTGTLTPLLSVQEDQTTYIDNYTVLMGYSPRNLELHPGMRHVTANDTRLLMFSEGMVLMWLDMSYKKSLPSSTPVSFRGVHFNDWKGVPFEAKETLYVCNTNASAQVEVVDEEDNIVMNGRIMVIDNENREKPCPLSQLVNQKPITIERKELYEDLSARGLEYCDDLQNINYINMDTQDWVISVTHNGDWCCFLESLMQVFILRDMDVADGIRLPKHIRRLDIDASKIDDKSSVVMLRLNMASGILEGEGVYAAGFSSTPCPASLRPTTLAELEYVPFGETKFKTIRGFLRSVVSTGLDQKEGNITLMELASDKQTTNLRKALAQSIYIATGCQPRTETLHGEKAFEEAASFLVSGPSTVEKAKRLLAEGRASMLLVASSQRLSESPALAVLAEQSFRKFDTFRSVPGFGRDWLTLLGRASMPRGPVMLLGAAAQPPAVVQGEAVLVWRGVNGADVQALVQQVDSRPYASRVRMVFILHTSAPPFSLMEDVYTKQLVLGARVNVLAEDGCWGCWRAMSIPKPLGAVLSASTVDNVELEFVGANPLDEGSLSGHIDFVGAEAGGNRVMGIGQWRADYTRPKLDPLLRWPVPEGWSAKDAATVPFIYSAVYYALIAKAEARAGESILIQDGTSALGQAAIRVATQLGCSPIYVTVRDTEQREVLREMFPQLEPSHTLLCGEGAGKRGSFEYALRVLTRDKGVRLIVNSLPRDELKASIRCLGLYGRLLHFNREDALAANNIGMYVFNYCSFVHGFSGDILFTGSYRDRATVAKAVREGLAVGVVQPIVGAEAFDSETGRDLLSRTTKNTNLKKVVVQVKGSSASGKKDLDPKKCFIVVGTQTSDVLLVAGRLSVLGARRIVAAVGPSPSRALIQQRQRDLQRLHGTVLRVRETPTWNASAAAAVVQEAASLAPVGAAVVIAKDDEGVVASSLLGAALDTPMVLLGGTTCGQVAALTARRNASGRGTACMAVPLAEAVDHLADLLGGATPPITVVDRTGNAHGVEEDFSAVLSSSALVELGLAAARCGAGPFLREIPSLSPPLRFQHSNPPLFLLPPLGVLHPRAEIASLAAKLLSPVVVVECVVSTSVKDSAAAVVKVIVERQPFGPYNVLGWSLSTVLAMEVQRQLESLGQRGKLFLVHGDVSAVRRWAAACPPPERVGALVAEPEAQRGARMAVSLLHAVAHHESDVRSAFAGGVHVIRASTGHRQSLDENESEVEVCTICGPNLGSPALAAFINDNSATSLQATKEDLRLSVMT